MELRKLFFFAFGEEALAVGDKVVIGSEVEKGPFNFESEVGLGL